MKNDFCVEEMMETQFPENSFLKESYEYSAEVGAWFERCMADYPHMDADIYWNGPTAIRTGLYDDNLFHQDLAVWYERWFSQFTTKDDKDE